MGVGTGNKLGEVSAENIGLNQRREYTVRGDAVNTPTRLCRTAGANEILISEPFYQRLKRPPPVEALHPIQVEGKTQKVPVYPVEREGRPNRSRTASARGSGRGPTPEKRRPVPFPTGRPLPPI